MRYHIYILALCLTSVMCSAQTTLFSPYTTNNGLSQNSVTSIAQDNFGFLWIATQDGLNRFDGTNFKKYEGFFLDETKERYSRLGKVYVDGQNNIWAVTSDGYVKQFNQEKEQLDSILHLPNASILIQTSENEYLVGSYTKGLYTLSVDPKMDTTLIKGGIGVYNIIEDNGSYLVTTDQGVKRYDPDGDIVFDLFPALDKMHVSDIAKLSDSTYVISTFAYGLFIGSDSNVESYPRVPSDIRVQDLHISKDGDIWAATYTDGLYRISENVIQQYKADRSTQRSINYNDVLCIYKDRNDNIWIGTDGGGLSVYNSAQKPIYSVTNDDMPLGMAVDVPRAMSIEKNGNIWVGTSGKGLTLIDNNNAQHRYYSTDESGSYNITGNRIMSLCHNEADDLWIGTQEHGLLYKPADDIVVKSVQELSTQTIWDIDLIDDSRLLLSTRESGIILYNTRTTQQSIINTQKEHSYRVAIPSEESNTYYIGTDDGMLLTLDIEKEKLDYIASGVELGAIKSLYLDKNILWIGTQKNGIYIYDLETNREVQLDQRNGLPNNVVYAIMEEDDQSVWASTNNGICEISKEAVYDDTSPKVIQHLTIENGLICNEYNTGAYAVDEHNNLYFGGIDGVVWFDPRLIRKDLEPIDIMLLELITTQNNVKVSQELHDIDDISIPFSKRHFQIRYSDLSYSEDRSVKYRYRLRGYNDEWTDNEEYKLANFSNVPPGDYTFQIIASNNDGNWNKIPKEIGLSVTPAIWQTLWFRLVIGGLLVLGIYQLIQMRISYIKRNAMLNQQIAESEAKALKSQMNPHFLFNSLNAIDNYILNNKPEEASDYLSKFSKLIRQTLDYSDQSYITLAQEIELLGLYVKMEQMRFPAKFDFNIHVDHDVDPTSVKVPPLIIQPYVENAIWHGLMHLEDDGELIVSFKRKGTDVICEIDDNGIGRTKAMQIKSKSGNRRKSHGMKITSERLKLLNAHHGSDGNVIVKDKYSDLQQSLGTRITIKIPNVTS